ncbi:uncharacterized protein [Typha angustifolia]|uniref:uncharacterized protein n=1 Tax=Typha angustifolia TaxID=59011 RepID=UPI003C2E2B67
MEEKSRSSSRLKERVAKIFQPKSLLRSSCKASTSSAASVARSTANSSSQTLLSDVAVVPRRRRVHADTNLVGLGRSKSFSAVDSHRRNFSVDCGGCRPNRDALPPPLVVKNVKTKDSKGLKKERRIRENGGFYVNGEGEGRTCPPSSPSMHSSYYEKKKNNNKKKKSKKLLTNAYGFSSSSSLESDDGYGFFSSEEEVVKGEKETFFSSRSFSSDSSEFYQRPLSNSSKKSSSKRKQCKHSKKKKKSNSSRRLPPRRLASSCDGCKVREGFRPLVSTVAAKETKKGFAVVKRSSDPYNDFRTSMVEMIVERQIFGAKDLERLLHSYYSLNSPHHHPVILQAFSDIWVVLFAN